MFSVDAAALKAAAGNELTGLLSRRRLNADAASRSADSTVTATLRGSVLACRAEAVLS